MQVCRKAMHNFGSVSPEKNNTTVGQINAWVDCSTRVTCFNASRLVMALHSADSRRVQFSSDFILSLGY